MCWLLLCPGRGLGAQVAELVNSLYMVDGLADYYASVSGSEVDTLWFSDPRYEAMEAAGVATSGRRLLGFGWAWSTSERGQGYLRLFVEPRLSRSEALMVASQLLGWARWVLIYWEEAVGVVELRLGPHYGYMHRLLGELLGQDLLLEDNGYLMVYTSQNPPEPPRPHIEFRLREANPHHDRSDLRSLVEVFNNAFSVYPDFMEWSLEAAANYYKTLYMSKTKKPFVLLAYTSIGEAIGFVEAYLHKSLSGHTVGYVSLLAVKQRYQHKGLGTLLLAKAVEELLNMSAKLVYLDAMPGPHQLYEKLGFQIVKTYVKARLPLDALPGDLEAIHELHQPTECLAEKD